MFKINLLGSGFRKLFTYCPIYVKDALSEIDEGDTFKISIQYEMKVEIGHELGQTSGQSLEKALTENIFYNNIVKYLMTEPLSRKEISFMFGKETASGHLNRIISKLFTDELIDHTIKNNPNHPAQKFKITEKGITYHNTIIEKQR